MMNINVASQNNGVLAFTPIQAAALSPPVDVRQHNNFGFTFQVTADIAVDAVFEVEAAPADAVDPCIPGAWHNVEEVLTCVASWGAVPAAESTVTIPAGTKKGAICTGTLPCKPDAFVRVVAKSGDTGNVVVVAVLGGPR
jgi:hypothetical protein